MANKIYLGNFDILENKQDKNIYYVNLQASQWDKSSPYPDYPYQCDINCSGVTDQMFAQVIFETDAATNGNYSPVCETLYNIVRIYSKTNNQITIPLIVVMK